MSQPILRAVYTSCYKILEKWYGILVLILCNRVIAFEIFLSYYISIVYKNIITLTLSNSFNLATLIIETRYWIWSTFPDCIISQFLTTYHFLHRSKNNLIGRWYKAVIVISAVESLVHCIYWMHYNRTIVMGRLGNVSLHSHFMCTAEMGTYTLVNILLTRCMVLECINFRMVIGMRGHGMKEEDKD